MKPVRLTEDILPLGEFKTQASRVLRQLKESQRPVIITQNGRPAGVLISPHDFDQMRERERFMAAVREGLADSEAGRVLEEDEVERLLDERYGRLEEG
ncbi:MAG TPA: type II toxin-antitoxin system prevent-host-death family antitoxin [Thermoanaerobaculia bacterium]|nr:type II toxin-antitoxin system prevent-host-death family antitoxin [Thermoanaerobaculia bacterium]